MPENEQPTQGFSRRDALILAGIGAAALSFMELTGDATPATAVPLWTGGWGSPLNGAISFSSQFLYGATGYPAYLPGLIHTGLDMNADANLPVYSIGAGDVLYVKFDAGIGNAALIRHVARDGTQFLAVYGHINLWVDAGDGVAAGQQIGTVYSWGAPHLHFGLRTNTGDPDRWGQRPTSPFDLDSFTDPVPFLNAHPASSSSSGALDMPYLIYNSGAFGTRRAYYVPGKPMKVVTTAQATTLAGIMKEFRELPSTTADASVTANFSDAAWALIETIEGPSV